MRQKKLPDFIPVALLKIIILHLKLNHIQNFLKKNHLLV